MTMYNFNRRSNDEIFNAIVEETISFAAAELANETIADKDNRIKALNEAVVKYCLADTRYEERFESEGVAVMKDPKVQKNATVLENYDAVLAEIINPIFGMVSNNDLMAFVAETRQIGWGDTARFIVKSNELYKVNEVAEGVNRGILQPIHDNEITVDTKKIEIAAEVDFYAIAAGVFDFADFGIRAARSFEQYIYLKVVGALTSAVSEFGSAYSATGFTDANWNSLAQKVSAANGNAKVFALGTLAALGSVVPSTAGLQYGLGQKIADQGFLDNYHGCRLICLDQSFATPWGYNTDAAFALSDSQILFLPVNHDHPVKVVYEGNSAVVERDPDHTPDRTYRVRIQLNVGVAAIVGSKFAKLSLQG